MGRYEVDPNPNLCGRALDADLYAFDKDARAPGVQPRRVHRVTAVHEDRAVRVLAAGDAGPGLDGERLSDGHGHEPRIVPRVDARLVLGEELDRAVKVVVHDGALDLELEVLGEVPAQPVAADAHVERHARAAPLAALPVEQRLGAAHQGGVARVADVVGLQRQQRGARKLVDGRVVAHHRAGVRDVVEHELEAARVVEDVGHRLAVELYAEHALEALQDVDLPVR
mmetsp:Transcript_25850/g.80944  ORF Transcript_25850/g.80944 Transcript_25850/m.80944 type:complete len:226 (-) Transcript_25850:1007-1684(-)